jgi:hypothetical protein
MALTHYYYYYYYYHYYYYTISHACYVICTRRTHVTSVTHVAIFLSSYLQTLVLRRVQSVPFILSLSTAAVIGCPGRFTLSMRYSCRARRHDKRDSLQAPFQKISPTVLTPSAVYMLLVALVSLKPHMFARRTCYC